ncbi:hypothetical protein DFO67_10223 [Modicisalibacter xianhensis]|uniref:Uncharacterized protein n=1 Tax=Modicisalibacter xianhensis TaxID=442341 RepID=A0A4R8FYC5_9GAMM|nr:hypothetical protein DFO67_10223 [Halomonas xianhensis]
MLYQERKPPLGDARDLQVGQRVEVGAAIGHRVIVLEITEVVSEGHYKGDQVAPDPLDHRPLNEVSRMKDQHFSWRNVLRIMS